MVATMVLVVIGTTFLTGIAVPAHSRGATMVDRPDGAFLQWASRKTSVLVFVGGQKLA